MLKISYLLVFIFVFSGCISNAGEEIICGADQPENYLPLLKNKRVALVVNHTSMVGKMHLADFLISEKIDVKTIFAPEHGFRGDASAGKEISDGIDNKTGLPVVSLYGKYKKPTPDHLKNIDLVVFDIQDVGCRFYTYISTLHLLIEACAENSVPLLVLDRPNPNGDYVAGPVLQPGFESFVGMDPIPVVHGCTVGEYAKMVNGEKWHKAKQSCDLTVIPVKNYSHKSMYRLPVKPSPNLPNYLAVRLYPSLCFFEATSVSVGRGTEFPFQVLGGLDPGLGAFKFVPRSISGVSIHPLNEGKTCYGIDLRKLKQIPQFTLQYFLDFYTKYDNPDEFITRKEWLNKLAGTNRLFEQILAGKSNEEINKSWASEIENYKSIRKKYLLYPDFED